MLLIKTSLQPSKIHGTGLFANQAIPKGTVIWKFIAGFDLEFAPESILNLPEAAKDFIEIYTYVEDGLYKIDVDNARFMNHSNNPNTNFEGDFGFALRDIEIGEELTCDYRKFDDEFETYGRNYN